MGQAVGLGLLANFIAGRMGGATLPYVNHGNTVNDTVNQIFEQSRIAQALTPSETVQQIIEQSVEEFKYESTLATDQIRLLTLSAGDGDSIIICDLHTVHPSAAKFHALSYAWEGTDLTHTIICNGGWMRITKSLHSALWHLREDDERTPLWVDAICIHQTDLEEKTQQVREMANVYRNAAVVILWLGEARAGTGEALEVLGRMADTWPELKPSEPRSNYNLETYDPAARASQVRTASIGLPHETSAVWQSVGDVVRRPWFGRMWILREHLAARTSYFRIGHLKASVDCVLGGMYSLSVIKWLSSRLRSLEAKQCAMYSPILVSMKWESELNIRVADLLLQTKDFECTDPRDKLFAALGLASGAADSRIDYSRDLRTIQTSIVWPDQKKPLELIPFLTNACYIDSRMATKTMPSWIPNWRFGLGFRPLNLILFDEQGVYSSESRLIYEEPDVLVIRGRIFDLVETIVTNPDCNVDYYHRRQGDPAWVQGLLDSLKFEVSCRLLAKRTLRRDVSEGEEERYTRCMVFDRTMHAEQRPGFEVYQQLELWRQLFTYLVVEKTAPSLSHFFDIVRREIPQAWEHIRALTDDSQRRDALDQFHSRAIDGTHLIRTCFERRAAGRHFFASSAGFIGWAPAAARSGDEICVFHGFKMPFVIRRTGEGNGFSLIGACYLQGLMDGEPFYKSFLRNTSIRLV